MVAPELVRLIGGDEFEGAADTLRILLFAGRARVRQRPVRHALIAGGRQGSALWLGVAALAFNVPLNFALVPALGHRRGGGGGGRLRGAAGAGRTSCWCAASSAWRRACGCCGERCRRRRDGGGAGARRRLAARAAAAARLVLYVAGLWALGGIDRRMLEALRA